MTKHKLKNMYTKWPSRENIFSFKKSKNVCNNLSEKAK